MVITCFGKIKLINELPECEECKVKHSCFNKTKRKKDNRIKNRL